MRAFLIPFCCMAVPALDLHVEGIGTSHVWHHLRRARGSKAGLIDEDLIPVHRAGGRRQVENPVGGSWTCFHVPAP